MLVHWIDRRCLIEHIFSPLWQDGSTPLQKMVFLFPTKLVFQHKCAVQKLFSNQCQSDFRGTALEKSVHLLARHAFSLMLNMGIWQKNPQINAISRLSHISPMAGTSIEEGDVCEWYKLSSSPSGRREKYLHIICSAQHNSQADGNIQETELQVNVITTKHTQARVSLEHHFNIPSYLPFYILIISHLNSSITSHYIKLHIHSKCATMVY